MRAKLTVPTQNEANAYVAQAKQLRAQTLAGLANRLFRQLAELMERMTLRPSKPA